MPKCSNDEKSFLWVSFPLTTEAPLIAENTAVFSSVQQLISPTGNQFNIFLLFLFTTKKTWHLILHKLEKVK